MLLGVWVCLWMFSGGGSLCSSYFHLLRYCDSLYMTSTCTGCENIEAENAKVVTVTHVDLLNQDNSVNGGDNVKEPVDGKEVTERHATVELRPL